MENIKESIKPYHLFVLTPTREHIALLAGYRFTRVTPSYALVYTEETAVQDAVEVDEKSAGKMMVRDKEWFLDCCASLHLERLERDKEQIRKRLDAIMTDLEREVAENGRKGETYADSTRDE